MVSLCFPIFFHPDCTVGFGVSPNHALRLVGCTTGRESHPALKILDSISGSIIAWYIIECKPFLKPGQSRDGTTFRRRTLSRGLAPSSSLSFCQSFHRVFLQAAESDVFSKVRVCEAQRSNESPSGAFKRQNGLAQQDGGALPRQVHLIPMPELHWAVPHPAIAIRRCTGDYSASAESCCRTSPHPSNF